MQMGIKLAIINRCIWAGGFGGETDIYFRIYIHWHIEQRFECFPPDFQLESYLI